MVLSNNSYEKIVDNQLKLQVDISFASHHKFMIEENLSNCHAVMDIGTGNGYFLSKLAALYPRIQFFGIDKNRQRIELAKNRFKHKNIKWIVGDVNELSTFPFVNQVDGILMRYFLLHLKSVKAVLLKLFNAIKPSAHLWIIDLDLNSFICRPSHSGFVLLKNLVKEYCNKSSESLAATQITPILEGIGFSILRKEIDPFTNKRIRSDLFRQFIEQEAMLYHYHIRKNFDSNELQQIRNFIHSSALNDYFVQYGIAMISAIKQNAQF